MNSSENPTLTNTSPIVIIGRGGSGTRILSELVLEQGVFLGNKLNISFDSEEWVKTIYGMVIDAHTFPFGLNSDQEKTWGLKMQETADRILQEHGVPIPDFWGWKLPETTLIVPQVLTNFPNARFIHLIRHPVSSCCRRSHITSRTDSELGRVCLTRAYEFIGRSPTRIDEDATHIRNAASWAFQVTISQYAVNDLKDEKRKMQLKFETLCDDPTACRDAIRAFLGMRHISLPPGIQIDSARRNESIVDSKEAAEVWDICQETATMLGYSHCLDH